MNQCSPYAGRPIAYQNVAGDVLVEAGWTLFAWDTIVSSCGEPLCLTVDHLRVERPRALEYAPYVCVYCGSPGRDRDHLLPRAAVADGARPYVLTVPACGECNGLLSDNVVESITGRRLYVQERLKRRHKKLLSTIELGETDLEELGPSLRLYVRQAIFAKEQLLERLRWPVLPTYDLEALRRSGVDDPFATGLLREVNEALWASLRPLL